MGFIEIRSTDNTDVIVVIDRIQYVIQKKDHCVIGMDNGDQIKTGAAFKDLRRALKHH